MRNERKLVPELNLKANVPIAKLRQLRGDILGREDSELLKTAKQV